MYLLIPGAVIAQIVGTLIFTFHNVSINSNQPAKSFVETTEFTFHNVSINSCLRQVTI